ncbi:hypothetical protein [Rubritalea halochordaticola]|uniref:hypothetical protein n=1 Tax=Rubritalea halochordaticola TaxID=714537 RepID=UPI0031FDAF81
MEWSFRHAAALGRATRVRSDQSGKCSYGKAWMHQQNGSDDGSRSGTLWLEENVRQQGASSVNGHESLGLRGPCGLVIGQWSGVIGRPPRTLPIRSFETVASSE